MVTRVLNSSRFEDRDIFPLLVQPDLQPGQFRICGGLQTFSIIIATFVYSHNVFYPKGNYIVKQPVIWEIPLILSSFSRPCSGKLK